MADSFELTIQIDIIESIIGSLTIAPSHPTGIPKYSIQRIALSNGANTFTPPTGATFCLILFDPTSATAKKLKGAGGDTGITLQFAQPILVPISAGNIVIDSTGADATITQVIFF